MIYLGFQVEHTHWTVVNFVNPKVTVRFILLPWQINWLKRRYNFSPQRFSLVDYNSLRINTCRQDRTHTSTCVRLLLGRLWPRDPMKVGECVRDDYIQRVRGGGGLGGNIYGTGERNPWEFSSLAYESNSSIKKKETDIQFRARC